jgi:hypothetical protein
LASCNDEAKAAADKTITVTGIPHTGDARIILFSSLAGGGNPAVTAAEGIGTISGGSVTFTLYSDAAMTAKWNGSGSFFIVIADSNFTTWAKIYTDGETNQSTFMASPNNYRYNITAANTTIPYDKFGINYGS